MKVLERQKKRIGVVVSDKMDKTVVVRITTTYQHPEYKKYVKKYKKFLAHDEKKECSIGDKVQIRETRPLSKRKKWRVVRILEKVQ